ncbi:MAG: YbhB/YbcL family Raf kinase inhibitor-like protein [Polyangiaceae bacterium]|nr:YbhB/YbcL family Raf kinase inhibitor-like protein [Polyangiaceae bacterium]
MGFVPLGAAVVLGSAGGCTRPRSGPVTTTDSGSESGRLATSDRAALTVTSTAFGAKGAIPSRFTCDGENVSPPLAWTGAPHGTRSFAIVIDDLDAPDPEHPKVVWVHWVVADIPATTSSIPEGGALPRGAVAGMNDWKKPEYGGPCPPVGRHRYLHRVYALDAVLGLSAPSKGELERAIKGHVLARGELVGTYEKAR